MSKRRWIIRLAGLAALTGGMALLAVQLPADTWTHIARQTALAAVSLQQVDGTAEQLSRRLERLPAGAAADSTDMPVNGTVTAPALAGAEQQPMAEPTLPAEEDAVTVPAEDGSGGKVVEQAVGGGTVEAGIAVKNQSGVQPDLEAALTAKLPFTIEVGSSEPQVLIYHTHATETYMPYDAGYYNSGDTERIPENPYNVRAVGDALEAELIAAGIAVLHDTTLHDSPSYRGAYDRSAETIQAALEEHPSIKVTLDIHRDGLMLNSSDKLKPTVTVEGKKAAQLMLVCGTLTTDALPHPNWKQNLSFAAQLQQTLDNSYGELARPLSLVSARYNQYMTTGSLLVEVGSEGNTLEEATYSARLLGRALVELLT